MRRLLAALTQRCVAEFSAICLVIVLGGCPPRPLVRPCVHSCSQRNSELLGRPGWAVGRWHTEPAAGDPRLVEARWAWVFDHRWLQSLRRRLSKDLWADAKLSRRRALLLHFIHFFILRPEGLWVLRRVADDAPLAYNKPDVRNPDFYAAWGPEAPHP